MLPRSTNWWCGLRSLLLMVAVLGWWRDAMLLSGKLEEALSALTSRTGELRSYYESEALLLHGDSVALLLTSLASLEHFELVVEADDECLDTAPKWPLIRFPSPPPDMTPSTSCDGVVLGAELVKAVEKFKLDDDMESGTIERFKRCANTTSSRQTGRCGACPLLR